MTIAAQADYWSAGRELDTPIYGGTQAHVMAYYHGELMHRPWWFFIPDLPFSLAADTGILPLT